MTGPTTIAASPMRFESARPQMTASMAERGRPSVRRRRERREYWVIFGVCFIFFIVAAALARLRPSYWMQLSNAKRSIWAEAKEEARLCTAVAFQG